MRTVLAATVAAATTATSVVVALGAAPAQAGTTTPVARTATTTTALPASVGGRTTGTVTITGAPGEYFTGGRTFRYEVPARGEAVLRGEDELVSIDLFDGAVGWDAIVRPPAGQVLAAGRAYPLTTAGHHAFTGNGRSCTLKEGGSTARVNAFSLRADGRVKGIDLTVHAECADPALRGSVDARFTLANPEQQAVTARTTLARDARGVLHARSVVTCVQPGLVDLAVTAAQGMRTTSTTGSVTCRPGAFTVWQGSFGIGYTPDAIATKTVASARDTVSLERVQATSTSTAFPGVRRVLAVAAR